MTTSKKLRKGLHRLMMEMAISYGEEERELEPYTKRTYVRQVDGMQIVISVELEKHKLELRKNRTVPFHIEINAGNVNRSYDFHKDGTFVRLLVYMAERACDRVVKVNPANTSQMYSDCDSVKAMLLNSERVYSFSNCGIEIDRDVNVARNILWLAQAMSSVWVSAEKFGKGVKENDGVVERTKNSKVIYKSTI